MDVNAKETTLPLNLFLMSLLLGTGDLMDRCSFVQIIIRNVENPKKKQKVISHIKSKDVYCNGIGQG